MKKLSLLLFLLLILGSVFAISSAADGFEFFESAKLKHANIAKGENGKTHLAFTIEAPDLDDDERVGLAVWYDVNTASPTAKNADFITFKRWTDGAEKEYFATPAIADSEFASSVLVAPVINSGNLYILGSEPIAYAVFDYAIARLGDGDVTEEQRSSYRNILTTETENTTDFCVITATGGYVGYGRETLLAARSGEEFFLRADAKRGNEYFLGWQSGEDIITDRIVRLTAPSGTKTYTAVYGEKSASAYGGTYDFESHATGELQPVKNSASLSTEGQYKNGYYWRFSGTDGDISFANGYLAAGDKLPFKEKYIEAADSHEIAEKDGNKSFLIQKNQPCVSMSDTILAPNSGEAAYDTVELDFTKYSYGTSTAVRHILRCSVTVGGKVKTVSVSLNLSFSSSGLNIYVDGKSAEKISEPYKYTLGDALTCSYTLCIVDGKLAVTVMLNGLPAAERPLVTDTVIDEGTDASVVAFQLFHFVQEVGKTEIDNLTFFESEENL